MQTIVLFLCYIVLILLFSTAYNTFLLYCFVIWCLHTNKRRPCSSTLSGHPSSSFCLLWKEAEETGSSSSWAVTPLACSLRLQYSQDNHDMARKEFELRTGTAVFEIWRSLYSLNSDKLIEAADAKELRTWLASIQVWPSSPLSSKDPAVGGFCLSSLKFIPAHIQPYLDELCWTCVVECKIIEYWLRIGVIALQCRHSSRSLTKMQMPTPW